MSDLMRHQPDPIIPRETPGIKGLSSRVSQHSSRHSPYYHSVQRNWFKESIHHQYIHVRKHVRTYKRTQKKNSNLICSVQKKL